MPDAGELLVGALGLSVAAVAGYAVLRPEGFDELVQDAQLTVISLANLDQLRALEQDLGGMLRG